MKLKALSNYRLVKPTKHPFESVVVIVIKRHLPDAQTASFYAPRTVLFKHADLTR